MPYSSYHSILFTLLHSIWQMGFLYLIYKLFISPATQNEPAGKKKVLFFIAGFQFILSIFTFFGLFFNYFNVITSFTFQNLMSAGAGNETFYNNLFYVYCCFVIARCIYISFRYHQQKNLIGRSLISATEHINTTINKLSSQLLLHKKITCWCSEHITSPIVYGFIKPIIVFPVAALNALTAKETESLLLHELAHIKNNDHLLNLLLIIQETLFFFNPFMWLIAAEIRKEREKACDIQVISHGLEKTIYATALYKVAQPFHSSQLTLAATGHKNLLLERIKFFMQEPAVQTKKISFSAILFSSLCFLLISLLSVISFTEIMNPISFKKTVTAKLLLPLAEKSVVKTESLPGNISSQMILPETMLEPKKTSPQVINAVKAESELLAKIEAANLPDLPAVNITYASNEEKNQRIIYIEEENSDGHKTLTMISVQQDGTTIIMTPVLKVETALVAHDSVRAKIDSSIHKVFIYH